MRMIPAIRRLSLSILLVLGSVSVTNAQLRDGDLCLGVHSGLIGTGGALAFGCDGEIATGKLGPGRVGIGGLGEFYSWRNPGMHGKYQYTDLIATCMYHAVLGKGRIDPFAGFFIGYEEVTLELDPSYRYLTGGKSTSGQSSPTLGLGGGIRYFFSRDWALQARVGAGYGYYLLAVGLTLDLHGR